MVRHQVSVQPVSSSFVLFILRQRVQVTAYDRSLRRPCQAAPTHSTLKPRILAAREKTVFAQNGYFGVGRLLSSGDEIFSARKPSDLPKTLHRVCNGVE